MQIIDPDKLISTLAISACRFVDNQDRGYFVINAEKPLISFVELTKTSSHPILHSLWTLFTKNTTEIGRNQFWRLITQKEKKQKK